MSEKAYVWDRFIRVFHWTLVVLFITSYFTGEEDYWLHPYSGYAIVGLVGLRLIWGLVGSEHARFKDFIYSPTTIIQYTKSMFAGHPRQYLGHNPLAGLMVITLLATLTVTLVSGLKLYAVEEGRGPFAATHSIQLLKRAQADSDDHANSSEQHGGSKNSRKKTRAEHENEEFWEEIHEGAVNFMLLLIALHITGVIVSGRIHQESLIRSMISGYKEKQHP